jgi:hypothetical protein
MRKKKEVVGGRRRSHGSLTCYDFVSWVSEYTMTTVLVLEQSSSLSFSFPDSAYISISGQLRSSGVARTLKVINHYKSQRYEGPLETIAHTKQNRKKFIHRVTNIKLIFSLSLIEHYIAVIT